MLTIFVGVCLIFLTSTSTCLQVWPSLFYCFVIDSVSIIHFIDTASNIVQESELPSRAYARSRPKLSPSKNPSSHQWRWDLRTASLSSQSDITRHRLYLIDMTYRVSTICTHFSPWHRLKLLVTKCARITRIYNPSQIYGILLYLELLMCLPYDNRCQDLPKIPHASHQWYCEPIKGELSKIEADLIQQKRRQ